MHGCCPPKELALPISADGPSSISDLVDSLPLGRFHALHVLRQIVLNACFAIVLEITPYVFQGLESEFSLSRQELAIYSALFTAGAVVGAALVSLQDEYGRLPVIRVGAFSALVFAAISIVMPTFTLLCILRVPLGISFAFLQYGCGTWFTEFLPTAYRGPLYVCLTVGYPIGRALAIATAWSAKGTPWRWMLFEVAGAIAVVLLLSFTMQESARYFFSRGDVPNAYKVMRTVYSINGTPFPDSAERLIHSKASSKMLLQSTPLNGAEDRSLWAVIHRLSSRWQSLQSARPDILAFALLLFCGISLQQALILNWGPHVFQELLFPDESSDNPPPPYAVLFGWNFADWLGILVSVFLIDSLGRRVFFVVGFFVAAIFWSLLAIYRPFITSVDPHANPFVVLIIIGALAQATRGFVPEGGNLWALESFPTAHRATMYASCNVIYQLTATIIVPIASYAQSASYVTILLGYAGLQALLGIFTWFLPNETAKKSMVD